MPASLSNKKKSNKLLGLIYNYQPEQSNNSFVRSYSQLLNKHFSQSQKQKSSLRKSLSSSNTFRTKKSKKSPKKNKQLLNHDNQANSQKMNNFNESIHFAPNQQAFEKSSLQNSLDPEMLGSRISKQKLLQLNPESNLKLQKILMSKTRMIQKNSQQNVLLNQKLYQSAHEKRSLMGLMQNLRMEILKEKKLKAKISTNMGKLMNKIEEVNTGIRKTEEETFYVKKETKSLEQELLIQKRKNQQLQTISAMNNEKIEIEKELISTLCKDLERNKARFFQTKTHLNEIKQIYMRETKCLVKVEIHKHQSEQQMNLLCKTVEQSVINAKETPKN